MLPFVCARRVYMRVFENASMALEGYTRDGRGTRLEERVKIYLFIQSFLYFLNLCSCICITYSQI